MAGPDCAALHRRAALRAAVEPDDRSGLAAARLSDRAGDSSHSFHAIWLSANRANFRIRRQRDRHGRADRIAFAAGGAPAITPGEPARAAALGRGVVGLQRPGVCLLVLAPRCRRAAPARFEVVPYRRRFSVSADDARSHLAARDGRGAVAARVRRLSVPGVHRKHRFFADRCSRAFALGEGPDDGAIDDFAGDRRHYCRTRRQRAVTWRSFNSRRGKTARRCRYECPAGFEPYYGPILDTADKLNPQAARRCPGGGVYDVVLRRWLAPGRADRRSG